MCSIAPPRFEELMGPFHTTDKLVQELKKKPNCIGLFTHTAWESAKWMKSPEAKEVVKALCEWKASRKVPSHHAEDINTLAEVVLQRKIPNAESTTTFITPQMNRDQVVTVLKECEKLDESHRQLFVQLKEWVDQNGLKGPLIEQTKELFRSYFGFYTSYSHVDFTVEINPKEKETYALLARLIDQQEMKIFEIHPSVIKFVDYGVCNWPDSMFKKIPGLRLTSLYSDAELKRIVSLFPNVKHIGLVGNVSKNEKLRIFKPWWGQLETLSFESSGGVEAPIVKIGDVVEFFKGNPQLKSFCIHVDALRLKSEEYETLAPHFTNLHELYLNQAWINDKGLKTVLGSCKNLKKLQLSYFDLLKKASYVTLQQFRQDHPDCVVQNEMILPGSIADYQEV